MAEDPKTLREIIEECDAKADRKESFNTEHDIRQEAIKEIKLAESSIAKESTRGLFGWGSDFLFTKDVIGYIKWKNNITKEDLK